MAGFTKVDNALLEAVLLSRFTKRQLKILLLVLRFSIGFQKTYAVLRQSDYEFAGLSRYCVSEELQRLCTLRVLKWDRKRHLVWLNPDPGRWAVEKAVDTQRKFFKIVTKNSPKWQHASCRNGNIPVAEMTTHHREKEINIKIDKDKIFSSILAEYFLKVAPLSSEEAFILKELLACYGARTTKEAVAQMAGSGERSFSVFLKTVDGLAPRVRDGRLSSLRSSLKRYTKLLSDV
ncbi:MAG: replication protein [Dehalococcoidia bacterium]|nr:replication protein [Dehalococcoidia bacterium]